MSEWIDRDRHYVSRDRLPPIGAVGVIQAIPDGDPIGVGALVRVQQYYPVGATLYYIGVEFVAPFSDPERGLVYEAGDTYTYFAPQFVATTPTDDMTELP